MNTKIHHRIMLMTLVGSAACVAFVLVLSRQDGRAKVQPEIGETGDTSHGELSGGLRDMKTDIHTNDIVPAVSKAVANQRNNDISFSGMEPANSNDVKRVMDQLIGKDPLWEKDLHQYIESPDQMPQMLYDELYIIANSTQTIRRIQHEPRQPTQSKLDEAARKFEIFLKEREANYPTVIPDPGMISVSNAVAIATSRFPGYDRAQKPKVELDGKVYEVTLWQHRRPTLSKTFFMAILEIDAWTGEVRKIQIAAD